MSSIHGHEVLAMMQNNYYANEQALVEAIDQKFGKEAKFHTCSKSDMNAGELVALLKHKGKFKFEGEASNEFTVDSRKICRH
ncbi:YecH family protein [Orbaceae bacterium ac157xtp]